MIEDIKVRKVADVFFHCTADASEAEHSESSAPQLATASEAVLRWDASFRSLRCVLEGFEFRVGLPRNASFAVDAGCLVQKQLRRQ